MEGRHVFEHLTVAENLIAGAYFRGRVDIEAELDTVYRLLPKLADRRSQVAGYLSGGEQQMLAIARALMAKPRLLMLDEPSLGLAPLLVKEIFAFIAQINEEMGLTVLVVEQNARRALEIAHHGYIMEQGRIVLEGTAAELADNPDVKEFYLGLGDSGARKSFRDVKHYKRRKRWL
jgi:branched-chain amino acid transport system ATP-binding protein